MHIFKTRIFSMLAQVRVAVVGATGLVGQDLLAQLCGKGCQIIYALARQSSVGKRVPYGEEDLQVEWAESFDFTQVDVVFMAAGSECSRALSPKAVAAGCWVIDKSSAYRNDPTVPLVVPEVNGERLIPLFVPQLISSPNCSVTPLVMALAPLAKKAKILRANVATYQSVSGSGRAGIQALLDQSCAHLNTRPAPASSIYDAPIGFNCIPAIGDVLDNGYTDEEMKLHHEGRKILNLPDLVVNATAVRVPVFYGHALAVHVSLDKPVDVSDLMDLWRSSPGLVVHDALSGPTQVGEATGNDSVWIGRCRQDLDQKNDLNFWVVTDNLRKGAVTNAMDILCALVENEKIEFIEESHHDKTI